MKSESLSETITRTRESLTNIYPCQHLFYPVSWLDTFAKPAMCVSIHIRTRKFPEREVYILIIVSTQTINKLGIEI